MAHSQPDPKTRFASTHFHWWWIVLLLVLAGFALFGDKGVLRMLKTYHQRTELQLKIDRLTAENRQLKQLIEALQNDHATIERIARQELGMVRQDEIVYQFPNQQAAPESPAQQAR